MADRIPQRKRTDVCYLCGEKLEKPWSMDHVPPKCFFASPVMEKLKPDRLWTVPTHVTCNNDYKDDEEYFVDSVRLRVGHTWAGAALQIDFMDRLSKRDESKRLFGRTYRETRWQHFSTPSARGSFLVDIEHDDARITRLCWKIVRGLFFRERDIVLPADATLTFASLGAIEQASEGLAAWWTQASGKGRYPYPRVFEYRFKGADASGSGEEQWMLRMWEGLIWWTAFRPPLVDHQDPVLTF